MEVKNQKTLSTEKNKDRRTWEWRTALKIGRVAPPGNTGGGEELHTETKGIEQICMQDIRGDRFRGTRP